MTEKTALDQISNPEQQAIAKAVLLKFNVLGFLSVFTKIESGPIVDTYYYKPLPTSPLSKILSKTEDIALAVGVEAVIISRVLDEVAVEIPKKERTLIKFDDCLWQTIQEAKRKNLQLPLMLGKNTVGNSLVCDLATQPHLLIAGSTGAGKSVFLSELISTLCLTKTPSQLKLVLVDTKQLDLTLFTDLPHVIETVDKIEDLHDVLDMLKAEVRKRTNKMKGIARNISEYNEKTDHKLPYIVLVIDELADVISLDKTLAKDEDKDSKRIRISASLSELAAISRAAGIHIIAATQRPSVKVIDGDIKNNFPSRICFKLSSGIDSRVVINQNGAENLLGKGDFLYSIDGDSSIKRAHSAFVSLEDITRIVRDHEQIRDTFNNLALVR